MLRQMLVAVDGSVWSRRAAQHAFEVARAIGGRVTLLHVLENRGPGPPDLQAAQTLLRELSLLARRPPSCLIVPALAGFGGHRAGADAPGDGAGGEGGVAPAILAVADHLNAELIVMGLHGHDSLAARMLGRVVQQVLLDAHVPVQVVPGTSDRPGVDRWSAALAAMSAR